MDLPEEPKELDTDIEMTDSDEKGSYIQNVIDIIIMRMCYPCYEQ